MGDGVGGAGCLYGVKEEGRKGAFDEGAGIFF